MRGKKKKRNLLVSRSFLVSTKTTAICNDLITNGWFCFASVKFSFVYVYVAIWVYVGENILCFLLVSDKSWDSFHKENMWWPRNLFFHFLGFYFTLPFVTNLCLYLYIYFCGISIAVSSLPLELKYTALYAHIYPYVLLH